MIFAYSDEGFQLPLSHLVIGPVMGDQGYFLARCNDRSLHAKELGGF